MRTEREIQLGIMQCSPRTCFDRWTMEQVAIFLTSFAGGIHREARGIDKDSKKKSAKNSLESPTEFGYKCVCLNARSIVNE